MNVLLWVVQVLLALHTAAGAMWKFFNSSQSVSALKVLPHAVWAGMSVVELLCAVGLILPAFNKRLSSFAAVAAILIAVEMLMFCGLHLYSGDPDRGELVYWLVVAILCAFVAYGRLVLKPAASRRVRATRQPAT